MRIIVDTNVPVVANGHSQQASPGCIGACIGRLDKLRREDILVLDDGWIILREYIHNLRSTGQPGVGDAFLQWVLTNQRNPRRCELVHIIVHEGPGEGHLVEFPDDAELVGFDPSDRKFVAVALAHAERPPIVNAVDRDWWDYRDPLSKHGINVEFLCSDLWSS